MFHILGFLFFFILIILVIGLALISKVIRTILGIGRRMTTGNASSSTNTTSLSDFRLKLYPSLPGLRSI